MLDAGRLRKEGGEWKIEDGKKKFNREEENP
jgi:hypothetical protein